MAAHVAAVKPGILEVFVHHDVSGAWVFTPLSRSVRLEVREATEGVPPADCCGVIWRLDEQVLLEKPAVSSEDDGALDERGDDYLCLAGEVCGRMKRMATDMKRMKTVAAKLQNKLSGFEDQQSALQLEHRRLDESKAALNKQQVELKERMAQLDDERSRIKTEVGRSEEIKDSSILAAGMFFSVAQDEFVAAVPKLTEEDETELQHARLTPEAAFVAARDAFFQADQSRSKREQSNAEDVSGRLAQIQPQIDAVVRALLALQCLDVKPDCSGKFAQSLEQLASIAQVLAGLANRTARLPLAFAASTCAMWCALKFGDKLTQRWDEAQAAELIRELDGLDKPTESGIGQIARRTRQWVSHCLAVRRLLRACAEHADHRRRFIRWMGGRGMSGSSNADLRLLFLTREAAPAELAAHVRRLSTIVDQTGVTSSRRKRPRHMSNEGVDTNGA